LIRHPKVFKFLGGLLFLTLYLSKNFINSDPKIRLLLVSLNVPSETGCKNTTSFCYCQVKCEINYISFFPQHFQLSVVSTPSNFMNAIQSKTTPNLNNLRTLVCLLLFLLVVSIRTGCKYTAVFCNHTICLWINQNKSRNIYTIPFNPLCFYQLETQQKITLLHNHIQKHKLCLAS
jgi:hypothetical protein